MALELQEFASGDTDYIAKLNQNSTELVNAINALQTQMGAVSGGDSLSFGMFLSTLFNGADALIGPTSFSPTKSGTTLIVGAGGAYLAAVQKVATSFGSVNLSFAGQAAGTYYVTVTESGMPTRGTTQGPGTIYSVVWNGSVFGDLVYIAAIFYDTQEADASRKSLALGSPPAETRYATLDGRFEAGETLAKQARALAGEALADVRDLQTRTTIRKVGITVDGTIGVKGAIQLDFDGTIVGWSCIADVAGNLQVEVSRKTSLAPPSAPAIPDQILDKISASAPITLTASQSASSGTAGVSTWTTNLTKWCVLQFTVIAVTVMARATLYLRVQEIIPVINPLESPPEDEPLFLEEVL